MSMKPGATTRREASMRRFAAARERSPTAAIRSPTIPTSPRNHGAPVPSTTRPPAMIRLKLSGGAVGPDRTRAMAKTPASIGTSGKSAGSVAKPDTLPLPRHPGSRSEPMLSAKLANRYEVAAELGRGGMGVVYRARDPMLNRDVAVKVLATTELTPDIEERFQREAQIVAQMDHPGIVPIYDVGRHDGSLFFVMPLVEGTNLRRILWTGSLRLGDVLDIAIQVADALEYSHSRSVVHRDVKPENIMVARDESGALRVRVMDFGLAQASTENRLTKTGTLVGTVTYLSPEQVTAHSFDGRSDIYSLGTVMYECLTGEPPFAGDVQSALYRIVHEIPQPPRALGAEIREELQDIVLRCLEKDPARRPQKAAQVGDSLRRHRATLHSDEFSMSVVLTSSRTMQRPSASAFIGREKEFAELQRRLNAAVSGDCHFAVVAGEPGIGKTRLLEELKKLVAMRKIRVLYGRFVEQDQGFSDRKSTRLNSSHSQIS